MTFSGPRLDRSPSNAARFASILAVFGLGLAASACLGPSGPGGGLANSPWPKFQSNADNNGASPAGSVSGTAQGRDTCLIDVLSLRTEGTSLKN